jgi:CHRD domain
MHTLPRNHTLIAAVALSGALAFIAGCAPMSPMAPASGTMSTQTYALSGSFEVPPVTTTATGSATVTVNPDRTVKVTVTVNSMTATASHIHEGAAGTNGPVIVPFTKTGDNTFAAPADAKLTEAQYASYKAGNLYVNVHSSKNPGGEVRAQLKGN